VGPDVSRHRVGERVWVYEAQWRRPRGTAAECTVVPGERAVPLPASTTSLEGACLGIPAMTAHRCVFGDGPVSGQTVLVRGGTGRVGFYAVQLAKAGGATVIATAGSAEKQLAVEKVGADHVLNHHHDPVTDAVRDLTGGAGVDRIIEVDPAANLEAGVGLLAPHGTIVVYATTAGPQPAVPTYPLMLKNGGLRFVLVYDMPETAKQAAIDDLTPLLAGGTLRHQVGLVVPLEEIADAHRAVEESSVVGCVVVSTQA
jgi:NADPH2:quinone reductase